MEHTPRSNLKYELWPIYWQSKRKTRGFIKQHIISDRIVWYKIYILIRHNFTVLQSRKLGAWYELFLSLTYLVQIFVLSNISQTKMLFSVSMWKSSIFIDGEGVNSLKVAGIFPLQGMGSWNFFINIFSEWGKLCTTYCWKISVIFFEFQKGYKPGCEVR